jgi:2-methylcitrate dehydratase PrpD
MSETPQGADPARLVAAAVSTSDIGAMPAQAVDAAKKSLLDTLGVALAATALDPSVEPFIELAADQWGGTQATLWGCGRTASAAGAAFANGVLAHSLDFDDQTPWGQHASSSVIPSVLAVAERQGGVRGRDVLAGVVCGQDLFARLRCHVGWLKDWNLSSVAGVYAGAVASARTLKLDADGVNAALSIASQQSAGVMEIVAGVGGELRGKYAGFSAQAAVVATLLAQRGVGGVDHLFSGPSGVFATYWRGDVDVEGFVSGLGHEWRGASTLYKRWPVVGTAHGHIQATIQALEQLGARSVDVETIEVFVGDYHRLMCTPLEERREPRTLVDAKFSLPFLVALAAVTGDIVATDFSPGGLTRPDVLAVAQRVEPVDDSSLDWGLELPPGRVRVRTKDGAVADVLGSDVPGDETHPLTWQQVSDKFRANARSGRRPLDDSAVERVVDLVHQLEHVDDVAQIVRAVS